VIEPGESWSGRSFGDWLAFLRERGGSATFGFDGSRYSRYTRICLLRLDTDFYESTKHELSTLYPRLVPGEY
jgi:Macrocin-O-methyltransferase (TylF)